MRACMTTCQATKQPTHHEVDRREQIPMDSIFDLTLELSIRAQAEDRLGQSVRGLLHQVRSNEAFRKHIAVVI